MTSAMSRLQNAAIVSPVLKHVIHDMNIVYFMILRDKFGFDKEMLLKLYDDVKEGWDAVQTRHVSVKDMEQTLLDEIGFDVSKI